MFGRYALPTDDVAGNYTSVVASDAGSPGSPTDADSEYPAEYLVAMSNTGHLNLPSRPAKLSTLEGYWDLTYGSAITVVAVAIIYHNFDEGLDVTIESGASIESITIPAHHVDGLSANFTGWTVSPWKEFDTPITGADWRLSINEPNSLPPQVGRLMLLTSLRQLGRDVRYGIEEHEERRNINHPTELGIDTFYDLGGKERAFNGEFALNDSQTQEIINLHRSAHGRITPWLLIPDEDVNDAWLVRFEENQWSRVRETRVIEDGVISYHNILPYRVREISRGLPWP